MMPVAYRYIRGSYFLRKQKMNKSKKNYIKFAMPVAKHTAEYVSKCCLEGILSAWDFINPLNAPLNPICHLLALLAAHHILSVSRIRVKGFYRYEYVFWRLKQFFFSEFCQFHP
jgi:hypothetical protein